MGGPRQILHVDMDAFFASVEQRDRPELRGKAIVVGGGESGRRGVVTAASYEARAFGVRAAMPLAQALRLCPHAVRVPGRHRVYSAESRRVMAILERFTPEVERVSIDEAYMDVTGSVALFGPPLEIGAKVKRAVLEETGLTCSVGASGNKFLAKVAANMRKPDGLCAIDPAEAPAVLGPMPAGVLPGVGPATQTTLRRMGATTVAELRGLGEARLAREFGESGHAWWRLAHGIDGREVSTEHTARSISKEETFRDDIGDPARLRAELLALLEAAARNLREDRLLARRVTLKLRNGEFETFTRSATLDRPTDRTEALWEAAEGLLKRWLRERPDPLRLIGVALGGLGEGQQMDLFAPAQEEKSRRVDAVADQIVKRYGAGAIRRGGADPGRR